MTHPLKTLLKFIKDLFTRYPALLSGLIIYSYLLFTILHFLIKSRTLNPTFYDILETFDSLPFMWLLAVALVKIIDVRGKLHRSETERIIAQQQAELKQTQLRTLHEVVKSLQHHINNPLSIITLTISNARKEAKDNPQLVRHIDAIEESTIRIVHSMKEFFEAQSYETERLDPIVGAMTAYPGATQDQNKNLRSPA